MAKWKYVHMLIQCFQNNIQINTIAIGVFSATKNRKCFVLDSLMLTDPLVVFEKDYKQLQCYQEFGSFERDWSCVGFVSPVAEANSPMAHAVLNYCLVRFSHLGILNVSSREAWANDPNLPLWWEQLGVLWSSLPFPVDFERRNAVSASKQEPLHWKGFLTKWAWYLEVRKRPRGNDTTKVKQVLQSPRLPLAQSLPALGACWSRDRLDRLQDHRCWRNQSLYQSMCNFDNSLCE